MSPVFLRIPLFSMLLILLPAQLGRSAPENAGVDSLQSKYLEILEGGVDHFEPIFTEDLTDAPDAGFFDIRRYGNWTHPRNEAYHTLCFLPGNGQVVLTYAVLLKYSMKTSFGNGRYSRNILFDHLRKTIRWICLTSAYIENPYDFLPEVRSDLAKGKQWHRKWGLRQDLIGYLSLGVALLWNDLDQETRTLFQKVATGTAIKGRVSRTSDAQGNGNHDQVKDDLSSTIAAAYLFPRHPEHSQYWDFIEGAGLDLVSTLKDFSSETMLKSGRIRDLARGVNLYSDFSSLHHNHPSIWYGIDKIFEGRSYVELMAALTKQPVPDSYTYNGNGFDGVYEYALLLSTNDGILNHLRQPEYDSFYGAGLLAFCYGNFFKEDPNASALEYQAADILARHSKAEAQYDYHRGSHAKAAMAFLWHIIHRRDQAIHMDSSLPVAKSGTYFLEYLNCLIHRNSGAWSAFYWGTNREAGGGGPGGFIMPIKAGGPLIYNTSDSMTGAILEHRPFWLLGGLIFFTMLMFLFYRLIFRKRRRASEALFALSSSLLVSTVFILFIDLFYTLPVRIPNAVVPARVFPAISLIASMVFIALAISDNFEKHRYKIYSFSVALLIIPLSLLIMIRNPLSDTASNIFSTENAFFYLAIQLLAIALIVGLKSGNKHAWLIGMLLLLISSFGLWRLSGENLLHLRLVSIRNLPRVSQIIVFGVVVLTLYAATYFWKTKRAPFHAVPILLLLMFSAFSVVALTFGRFESIHVEQVTYEASDDGFSTAGASKSTISDSRQAFFTFDGGLTIALMDLLGEKSSLVTWSGTPLAFYQRNGYIEERRLRSEAGENPIVLSNSDSRWWCVDNLLGGMFISRLSSAIKGEERIGSNWARTEDYLDRVNVLSVAPKRWIWIKKGSRIERIMLAMQPNLIESRMKEFAKSVVSLEDQLPGDWMGAYVPAATGNDFLSIANFSCDDEASQITLGNAGWAPVFSMSGIIAANGNKLDIRLKPYGTFRDMSGLSAKIENVASIEAIKQSLGEYHFFADASQNTILKIRWKNGHLSSAILKTQDGAAGLPIKSLISEDGLTIKVRGKSYLFLQFDEKFDRTPPFIHIETPQIKNNLLEVSVTAADQSKLSSVTLYMDGREIATKGQPPYIWTIPAESSVHTFQAVAIDASRARNMAKSFPKTWTAGELPLKMARLR